MTLYLYKIGTEKPVLTVENARSYTADSVTAADGTVYGPLAADCELSSVPECTETRLEELEELVAGLMFGGEGE